MQLKSILQGILHAHIQITFNSFHVHDHIHACKHDVCIICVILTWDLSMEDIPGNILCLSQHILVQNVDHHTNVILNITQIYT